MNFLKLLITIYLAGSLFRFGVILVQKQSYELGVTCLLATLWLLWLARKSFLPGGAK